MKEHNHNDLFKPLGIEQRDEFPEMTQAIQNLVPKGYIEHQMFLEAVERKKKIMAKLDKKYQLTPAK